MGKYILKRILYAVIALFVVSTIAFFAVRMIPGNPIEAMTEKLPDEIRQQVFEQYGFDKPIMEQYKLFFKELFTEGDLGESLKYRGRKVTGYHRFLCAGIGASGSRGHCHRRDLRYHPWDRCGLKPGEMAGLSGHVHRSGRDRGAKLCAGVLLPVFPDHPLSSVPHHWDGRDFLIRFFRPWLCPLTLRPNTPDICGPTVWTC